MGQEEQVTRALIVTAVQDDTPAHAGSRPDAEFVAQLIATSAQAPQTRARRRAAPGDAIAAYDAVGHWPTPSGRTLSRSF
jgi:hypothetical protein